MMYKNIINFTFLFLLFFTKSTLCQANTTQTYTSSNSKNPFYFVITQTSKQVSDIYQTKEFKIDIYSSDSSKLIQSIDLIAKSVWSGFFPKIDSTRTVDVNFDGYNDLILWSGTGEMGKNNFNEVYIFNPSANKFIHNETFSSICNIVVDQKDKTVEEFIDNGGIINYTTRKYEVVNDSLILKNQEEQSYDFDNNCYIIETSYYDKGKFKYKKVEKINDNEH